MKYLFTLALAFLAVSCVRDIKEIAPQHICLSPSVEWEIYEGKCVITRPRIETNLDWNF